MSASTPFRQHGMLYITILLLAPLSSIGIDLYTPALPIIGHVFHANHLLIKLTLTCYLLGTSVGLALFGCFSDRWGRRLLLRLCLIIFCLINVLIIFNHSITLFILLRFIQGIFVGGIAVIPRAMLLDLYQGNTFKRAFSLYISIWSLGPIIAPFIGGYLTQHLGWQSCFLLLALYSLIGLILFYFFEQETLPHHRRIPFKKQRHHIKAIISHRLFILGTLILIFGYSFIIVFNVMAPFIIQKLFHHNPVYFGYVALIYGLSYLVGVSINTRLLLHYPMEKISAAGLSLMSMAIVAALLINGLMPTQNTYSLLAPPCLLIMGLGLVYVNVFAELLKQFSTSSGIAAALISGSVLFGAFATSTLASIPKLSSTTPFVSSYMMLMIGLGGGYWLYQHHRHQDDTQKR